MVHKSCVKQEQPPPERDSFLSLSLSMLQDYLPLQPLGNGATGIVFLAQPLNDQDALVAIKAFRRSRTHDLQRAHNEEQILSKLLDAGKHIPFLPRLLSAFEDGEFRFVVLDYCSGGDLNMLRHSLPDKRFSPAAIRFYAAEIVIALEHLHEEGIVYRDLKPENILLTSQGHVMLTDFDLSVTLAPKKPLTPATFNILPEDQDAEREEEEDMALTTCFGCSGRGINQRRRLGPMPSRRRVVPALHSSRDAEQAASGPCRSSSTEVRSNSFVGTEEYIAPEVIRGTGHDFAVDWWGLGVLLYEMAYACTPFSGRTSKETFHNILHQEAKIIGSSAGPLENLISRLLVKDPSSRLGSHRGAAIVKAHPFFAGVYWDALEVVLRTPFIPPSEPSSKYAASGFNLSSHLMEVDFSRAEARAKRNLQRKQEA